MRSFVQSEESEDEPICRVETYLVHENGDVRKDSEDVHMTDVDYPEMLTLADIRRAIMATVLTG